MTGQEKGNLAWPTTSSPSQTHEATWSNDALSVLALTFNTPFTNQHEMQSKACVRCGAARLVARPRPPAAVLSLAAP